MSEYPRLPLPNPERAASRFVAQRLGYAAVMQTDRARRQIEGLLGRLTGEPEARDAVARVACELRRQHGDLGERRRRQRAAARAEENPRRGVRLRAAATSPRH
jgi:hypothetical protein